MFITLNGLKSLTAFIILQTVELCDLFYLRTVQSTVTACTWSQICGQLLGTTCRQEIEESINYNFIAPDLNIPS